MIAFPGMLVSPAKEAGMKVPDDPENYDIAEFPHWNAYLNVQIGSSLPYASAHWDNAKIIASIPDDKINTVTYRDVLEMGLAIGRPIP